MKKALLVLAIVATLTTGCDDNDLVQGTVYEKKFHHDYIYYTTQCMAYSKNGACTLSIPVHHYVPESWEVCIQDPMNAKRKNCMNVNETTFDRTQVGVGYPNPQ